MNETELERLVVRLTGDGSQLQKTYQQAAASTQQFAASTIATLGTIGAAVGIAGSFGAAFYKFVGKEQEMIKLTSAVQANGRAIADVLPQYNAYASAVTKSTLLSRGEVMGLLRQAEVMGFSGEKAQQLATNAIGLGLATEMSAEHALHLVIAMERGNVQMLRRVPQLRGITDETKLVTEAQRLMNVGLKQGEALYNSMGGLLTRLGRSFGGLTTDIGELIAKAVRPLVEWTLKAVDWLKSFGPAVQNVSNAVVDVVTAMVDVVSDVASSIYKTLTGVWNMLNRDSVVPWNNLRELVTEALIYCEFAIRNFDVILKLVWAAAAYETVWLGNQIAYVFTTVIPGVLTWLANNWREVLQTMYNFAAAVWMNLGDNIVRIFMNIGDLITGRVSLADLWTPLTDGFRTALTNLPQIAARELGPLETQLREEFERLGASAAGSYMEFRTRRLQELQNLNQLPSLVPKIDRDVKHGLDQMHKLDAALYGSAEALSRIAEYKSKMNDQAAATGTAGGRSGSPVVEVRQASPSSLATQEEATRHQQILTALNLANNWLDKIAANTDLAGANI